MDSYGEGAWCGKWGLYAIHRDADRTILMDTKKHIRTFQRTEIIFPDMLVRCMEPYVDANYIMTKGKETYLSW